MSINAISAFLLAPQTWLMTNSVSGGT